jgi:hypothetical protein
VAQLAQVLGHELEDVAIRGQRKDVTIGSFLAIRGLAPRIPM